MGRMGTSCRSRGRACRGSWPVGALRVVPPRALPSPRPVVAVRDRPDAVRSPRPVRSGRGARIGARLRRPCGRRGLWSPLQTARTPALASGYPVRCGRVTGLLDAMPGRRGLRSPLQVGADAVARLVRSGRRGRDRACCARWPGRRRSAVYRSGCPERPRPCEMRLGCAVQHRRQVSTCAKQFCCRRTRAFEHLCDTILSGRIRSGEGGDVVHRTSAARAHRAPPPPCPARAQSARRGRDTWAHRVAAALAEQPARAGATSGSTVIGDCQSLINTAHRGAGHGHRRSRSAREHLVRGRHPRRDGARARPGQPRRRRPRRTGDRGVARAGAAPRRAGRPAGRGSGAGAG